LVGSAMSCAGVYRHAALGVAVGEGCGALHAEARLCADTVVGEARRRVCWTRVIGLLLDISVANPGISD